MNTRSHSRKPERSVYLARLISQILVLIIALGAIGGTASAVTTVIQPDAAEGKDTWIWPNEDFSHATSKELRTNETSFNQRILVEFSDLLLIPDGAIVNSASLELYKYAGFNELPLILSTYNITSAWDEDVSWSNAPTFEAAPESGAQVTVNGWYTWDLTSLVQEWIDGTTANNGVLLYDGGFQGFVRFASSDVNGGGAGGPHPGAEFAPKLVVDYLPEPSAGLLVGMAAIGLALRMRSARV